MEESRGRVEEKRAVVAAIAQEQVDNDDDDYDDHDDDDEDDKDNLLKKRSQISMTILIMIMLSCLAPST